MESEKLESVKPVPVQTDEEVGEGRVDKVEFDATSQEEQDENVEYDYDSHRSPFPEGKCSDWNHHRETNLMNLE
jgi:hypothetical protein